MTVTAIFISLNHSTGSRKALRPYRLVYLPEKRCNLPFVLDTILLNPQLTQTPQHHQRCVSPMISYKRHI